MAGETDLAILIRNMTPELQDGTFVFVTVKTLERIPLSDILCMFREKEGITVVIERDKADELQFEYDFLAAWITLKIHSSLDAVGLTAAFSSALAVHAISCNVIAGFYHDHVFVHKKDERQAIQILNDLSKNYN